MNRGMKKMNRGGKKMMMGGESMTPMKNGGKASKKKRGMARGCGAATKGKGYNK